MSGAMITGLFHIAIKTRDLAATVKFYCGVLGLLEVARPDFGYPGAWISVPTAGGAAIIHVYAGGPATGRRRHRADGHRRHRSRLAGRQRLSRLHQALPGSRPRLARVPGPRHVALAALRLRSQRRAARTHFRRPRRTRAAARHVGRTALPRGAIFLRRELTVHLEL